MSFQSLYPFKSRPIEPELNLGVQKTLKRFRPRKWRVKLLLGHDQSFDQMLARAPPPAPPSCLPTSTECRISKIAPNPCSVRIGTATLL